MSELAYRINVNKLCSKYSLGQPNNEPEQVAGGFLHRMYRLQTDKATYAVKALNPRIMLWTTAMGNFISSEKTARLACRSGIHALPAILYNGSDESCIHEADGQYYLLFPWVEGKTVPTGSVDISHCSIMGETLARLHNTDFTQLTNDYPNKSKPSHKPLVPIQDWGGVADQGKREGLDWSYTLSHHLDSLYRWEELARSASVFLSGSTVISHRDLDQKNVLWNDHRKPILIDWEAAGAVNPTQEWMETALYWSGFESGCVNKDAFVTFIRSYHENGGKIGDNRLDALNAGFLGKLQWLAYNINRSLRLETRDEAEAELGTREAVRTLQAIQDYAAIIPQCAAWLEELDDVSCE